MTACLERAGFVVTWQEDRSAAHAAMAQALAGAFAAHAEDLAGQLGRPEAGLSAGHTPALDPVAEGRADAEGRGRGGAGVRRRCARSCCLIHAATSGVRLDHASRPYAALAATPVGVTGRRGGVTGVTTDAAVRSSLVLATSEGVKT